jgi:hypothetical protein
MTDLHTLIEQLVDELDCRQPLDPDTLALMTRARTALAAEPQWEGPTDEELLSVDQLRDAWNAQADALNTWDELGLDEIVWWAQRQALTRWGRPAPPPVAGEVGELVADLECAAASYFNRGFYTDARRCRRAADLLTRLAQP